MEMALDEPSKIVPAQIVNKDPELGKHLKHMKEAPDGRIWRNIT